MQSVDVFINHELCERTILSSADFCETFVRVITGECLC